MVHVNYTFNMGYKGKLCLLTDVYGMKCTQLRSGLPKIGVQISNPQYHLKNTENESS